ncbi:MAG: hypothetical protein Kow0059_21070 [Candidatus Sumerlaeia bacterium]
MGISPAYIDDLRSRLDIVEVIQAYVPLKQSGANLKGLCPFHQEKTPSFMVSPGKQIYHCFGCGAGGDAVKFIMQIEKLTFREAVVHLARQFGLPLPPVHDEPEGEEEGARERRRRELLAVCAAADAFYQEQLLSDAGTPGRRYLEKRGVPRELWERFHLGWAPGSWQALYEHLRRRNFSDELIIEAGLCKKNENGRIFDMLVNRVVFALQDQAGQTVAFAGRVLDGGEPKYLNTPQSPLYNKSQLLYGLHPARDALRQTRQALILEGYLDVITAHRFGFANALATCGTAMTEEHARRLSRFVDGVTLLFDADPAGQKATLRAIELLLAGGHLNVKVCRLSQGEDPDSFLRKFGTEAFSEHLRSAADYWAFLQDHIRQAYPLARPDGKEQAVQALKPFLLAVRSDIVRHELVRLFADTLSLHEDLVWRTLAPPRRRGAAGKAGGSGGPAEAMDEDVAQAERARCHRDLMILKIMLERPDFRNFLPQLTQQAGFWDWFEDEQVARWLRRLARPDCRNRTLCELLEELDDEAEAAFLRRIAMLGECEDLTDPASAAGYLQTSLLMLKFDYLCQRHKTLHSRLDQADWQDAALLEEYRRVSQEKVRIRNFLNGERIGVLYDPPAPPPARQPADGNPHPFF